MMIDAEFMIRKREENEEADIHRKNVEERRTGHEIRNRHGKEQTASYYHARINAGICGLMLITIIHIYPLFIRIDPCLKELDVVQDEHTEIRSKAKKTRLRTIVEEYAVRPVEPCLRTRIRRIKVPRIKIFIEKDTEIFRTPTQQRPGLDPL